MDKKFKDVKILIWDFDGTLYPPSPDLWKAVREAEYKTIENHTKWPREKTVSEFQKLHKIVYPSATETVANLSGISTKEAAFEMEKYYDRRDFLTRDEKLIALFEKLKALRHFILANGVRQKLEETLVTLGLSKDVFEEIVTSETVEVNKPHDAGFRYILKKTNLPAHEHLMIGDRETVDLVPAKNVGMKTCLAWSGIKSSVADVTIPTVYDVPTIL